MSTPSPAAIAAPTVHAKFQATDTTATAMATNSDAQLQPSQPATPAMTENAGKQHANGEASGEHPMSAAPLRTTTNDRHEPGRFHSMFSAAKEGIILVVFVPVVLVVDVLDKVRGKPRRNHWQ